MYSILPEIRRGNDAFHCERTAALTHAFQTVWKALLEAERITPQNIERAPTLLMEAIVDTTHSGELDEANLAVAAVARFRSSRG